MNSDYYEILQVHPRADQAAIEAAYHRLRALYDPNRLDGAADELVELARRKRDNIERAWAVLGDETRRATYDAERTARPADDDDADEDGTLDYRPLPPARRSERPRDFDTETVARRRPSPARATNSQRAPVIFAAILLAVVLVGTATFLFAGQVPGALLGVQPTPVPTASSLDQFEPDIEIARAQANQNVDDPQAWIDYANLTYNSVEIVREFQPDSQLYQERLPRWLEATVAYSRALELQPDNNTVRADYGVSACFYGAGTNQQQFVVTGLSAVEQAAQVLPNDPRVLLGLGHCLVSVQPPRTPEALEAWLKIRESQPSESPFAQQAQQLIDQYN